MTTKQAIAIKKMSENIGKPIGQVMLESGYSPTTALTPKRLTQTKAWREVFDEAIPDELLNRKLQEGLDSNRTISAIGQANGKSVEFVDVPDMATRHKYLETAYKLKGRLKEQAQLEGTLNVVLSRGTDRG